MDGFVSELRLLSGRYNDAVMGADIAALNSVKNQFFSARLMAGDHGGAAADRACAAAPGAVPHWGQSGEFVFQHEGVPVFAQVQCSLITRGPWRVLYQVIDAGRPFVSEDGYCNHFQFSLMTLPVETVVAGVYAELIRANAVFVDPFKAAGLFSAYPAWVHQFTAYAAAPQLSMCI